MLLHFTKCKDLNAWNNCSLVLLIFEYCCLNWSCSPFQSKVIGLSDSRYSLASPTKVKQNLWTLTPISKAWVSIQSLILKRMCFCIFIWFTWKCRFKVWPFNWGIGVQDLCMCMEGWWGCLCVHWVFKHPYISQDVCISMHMSVHLLGHLSAKAIYVVGHVASIYFFYFNTD